MSSAASVVQAYGYHYDGRGDVVAQTAGLDGGLVYQAAYNAFGGHNPSATPPVGASLLLRSTNVGQSWGTEQWTGANVTTGPFHASTKEEDSSGLINEGQRYRFLMLPMFLTPDPLGMIDGPNEYAYVKQNPWTSFDPEGLANVNDYVMDARDAEATFLREKQQLDEDYKQDPSIDYQKRYNALSSAKDDRIAADEKAAGDLFATAAYAQESGMGYVDPMSLDDGKASPLTGYTPQADNAHYTLYEQIHDYKREKFETDMLIGAAIGAGTGLVWDAAAGVYAEYKLAQAEADALNAENKAADLMQGGCFAAGTLVETAGGLKPIEDVGTSDHVWAFDFATGKTVLEPVLQTFTHTSTGSVRVTIGAETVTCTTEHPFWVEGIGWVGAASLKPGEMVQTLSGSSAEVESVVLSPENITVYNFEVANLHDYFVTSEGLLVHNACSQPGNGGVSGIARRISGGDSVETGSTAVLKDGYYEVNGFKFSKYYYEKLWQTGRGAPSLTANEILASGAKGVPDVAKAGFMRYEAAGWEMVYNPTTKEVWHLQPIK